MNLEPTAPEVSKLLEKVPSAQGPELLQLAVDFYELAREEFREHEKAGRIKGFLEHWYGNAPGNFWLFWDKVSGKGKAGIVWSKEPLRNLLLLPATELVQTTILDSGVKRPLISIHDYISALIRQPADSEKFEIVRQLWSGRGGIRSLISDHWLKSPSFGPDIKRAVGKELQELSLEIEGDLNRWKDQVTVAVSEAHHQSIDLALPGVPRSVGTTHIIRQTISEIERIFLDIGFSVAEGPEIENTYFNFEALNIPEHHPARDDMDTFYIRGGGGPYPLLLRTHTSPVQIRTMQKQKPPVRIIVPGKVYRRDHPDATHGFMFHQVEGLAVDTDITFCDFKGVAEYFVREFLGPHVKTRLRPSYFQFTEPSAEVDGSCIFCKSAGCRICKFTGWIELFGAGMVDPAVYGFVNYDAQKLSGFAFGMGIDRLAMMKYGIDEVPRLFQNDVRFLRQFP
jgi:phenylalanyl-tRNA synthetase alpha chain